jgi:hypothetical protein
MAYPTGIRWHQTSATIGGQPVTQTEATAKHNLGQLIRAKDVTYGEVGFVYLAGVASTAQGDVVTFDERSGTTKRAVEGVRGPVVVAMSDCTAGLYGWYAEDGCVPVNTGSNDPSPGPAYLSRTAGEVTGIAHEGEKIDGLTVMRLPSSGYATCRLTRPAANGNDADASERRG